MGNKLPSHVEQVTNHPWVGQIFNFCGIEKDSQVGVFLVRAVSVSVVRLIDQFDFLNEFLLLFIKVCIG